MASSNSAMKMLRLQLFKGPGIGMPMSLGHQREPEKIATDGAECAPTTRLLGAAKVPWLGLVSMAVNSHNAFQNSLHIGFQSSALFSLGLWNLIVLRCVMCKILYYVFFSQSCRVLREG